jgi:hypothetical protein
VSTDATIGIMGDERIARRRVRARFSEGEVVSAAHADDPGASRLPARFVSSAMAVYGPAGGVWVGGTATLTRTDLTFAANWPARGVGSGVIDAATPLREVHAVFVTPSFPADVVTVVGDRLTMRLRCCRAQAFADQIAAAVDAPTP